MLERWTVYAAARDKGETKLGRVAKYADQGQWLKPPSTTQPLSVTRAEHTSLYRV